MMALVVMVLVLRNVEAVGTSRTSKPMELQVSGCCLVHFSPQRMFNSPPKTVAIFVLWNFHGCIRFRISLTQSFSNGHPGIDCFSQGTDCCCLGTR